MFTEKAVHPLRLWRCNILTYGRHRMNDAAITSDLRELGYG